MGRGGENRLQLRLNGKIGYLALFAIGATISPGIVSGETASVIAIFLGLFAASILPTVTLLINSMTASGRSILSINKLEQELDLAMDALFFLFGCIGIAIVALVALSIEPFDMLKKIPFLTTEILPRIGQALVVAPTIILLWRAGQITGILRRLLKIQHEIALDEAKVNLQNNAPPAEKVRQSFATNPEFGKVISLQEAQELEGKK